jgi:hypothetical protein
MRNLNLVASSLRLLLPSHSGDERQGQTIVLSVSPLHGFVFGCSLLKFSLGRRVFEVCTWL